MLSMLRDEGELVLCGDFNAPRNGEIQSLIKKAYKDNTPRHWSTTIDPHLHRISGLRAVVDGVFSSPAYQITNVRCRFGVSDHALIGCRIIKTENR